MSSNVIKSNISNIPTIPDYHYQRLPDSAQAVLPFLRYRHDYELFYLSYINAIGGLANNTYMLYNAQRHYPYFFLSVSGPFGTGKSAMNLPYRMLRDIDYEKRLAYEESLRQFKKDERLYNARFAAWEKAGSEGDAPEYPAQPKEDLMLLSTDITAAAMFDRYNRAEIPAAIYIKDEISTMIKSLSSQYGGFVDFLCNCFDQTDYSFERKFGGADGGMRTYVLRDLRLAMTLAGTPQVIYEFFNSNFNNGLMSRFMFYRLPVVDEYMPPVMNNDLHHIISNDCTETMREFCAMVRGKNALVTMTKQQTDRLTQEFINYKPTKMDELGNAFGGIVNRMQVICVRIATILYIIRNKIETGILPERGVLHEDDFNMMLDILKLIKFYSEDFYIITVQSSAKEESLSDTTPNNFMLILNKMKDQFTRGDFVDEARDFGVSERTAARWLKQFDKLIKKTNHGQYEKL